MGRTTRAAFVGLFSLAVTVAAVGPPASASGPFVGAGVTYEGLGVAIESTDYDTPGGRLDAIQICGYEANLCGASAYWINHSPTCSTVVRKGATTSFYARISVPQGNGSSLWWMVKIVDRPLGGLDELGLVRNRASFRRDGRCGAARVPTRPVAAGGFVSGGSIP